MPDRTHPGLTGSALWQSVRAPGPPPESQPSFPRETGPAAPRAVRWVELSDRAPMTHSRTAGRKITPQKSLKISLLKLVNILTRKGQSSVISLLPDPHL